LIDVGAVAAFRFKDTVKTSAGDTLVADKVPTIQLRDIISPGVFLSIGIPRSPISLNFGAQMGASLRKINTVSAGNLQPKNDLSNNTYWRFSASVCVDIPLLNFHTR
jgi:hypothetical protein